MVWARAVHVSAKLLHRQLNVGSGCRNVQKTANDFTVWIVLKRRISARGQQVGVKITKPIDFAVEHGGGHRVAIEHAVLLEQCVNLVSVVQRDGVRDAISGDFHLQKPSNWPLVGHFKFAGELVADGGDDVVVLANDEDIVNES